MAVQQRSADAQCRQAYARSERLSGIVLINWQYRAEAESRPPRPCAVSGSTLDLAPFAATAVSAGAT